MGIRHEGIAIAALALWLGACAEGVGPPSEQHLETVQRSPQHLRWQPELGSVRFTALSGESLVSDQAGSPSWTAGPILDTYEVSFWARRGENASIEIRYQAADQSWQPYAKLTIPPEGLAYRPDGTAFAEGDSILITMSVDTSLLVVHFEPTGLTFNQNSQADFQFWYTGADPDLDGNGSVDGQDGYIQENLLDIWVQSRADEPWVEVGASHALEYLLFSARLQHFSGYAVSH